MKLLKIKNFEKLAVECGRTMKSSRIVGGYEATPNEFPWMAHLKINFWSGDAANCGGTLISADHVLTAAHCLYGAVSVNITLGVHNVVTSSNLNQIFDVPASAFKSHPDWYYGQTETDIAIVRLPYPVNFNGNNIIIFS